MKVRASITHQGPDGTWRKVGDVLDLDRAEATQLVHEGRAELYGSERNRKDAPEALSPTTVVGPTSEGLGVVAPTVAELKRFAKDRGLSTTEAKEVWRREHSGAPASTVLPPTTETSEEG